TKVRKAKIARDISKNMSIKVPEHKIAAFKPADDFNKMVQ
ncbi:MAG: HU family DNA-binding protein, partial [Paludibacteraceae bacterium]|nr:HU family DNA-binding protein [Paludibacteraceae bacterium]